jgi:hypothetical protein
LDWWLGQAAFARLHHESLIKRIPFALHIARWCWPVMAYVIAHKSASDTELHVGFERVGQNFKQVTLSGPADFVFEGTVEL